MPKLILIADDNENDLLAVSKTLNDAGAQNPIVTVTDGDDVITYFSGGGQYANREKFPIPSVLLLDLKMQRTGAFKVLQWLSNYGKSNFTLVVVLSGHGELENVRNAYKLGARSFLTKPCTTEDASNLIRGYPEYWETAAPITQRARMANEYGSGITLSGAPT